MVIQNNIGVLDLNQNQVNQAAWSGNTMRKLRFSAETEAVISAALRNGAQLPSEGYLALMNEYLNNIKELARNGLGSFADIAFFNSDITHGDGVPANLGFDGIKWNNPNNANATRVNTITKAPKGGYSSNGTTSCISLNYIPSQENITDVNDTAMLVVFINLAHDTSLRAVGTSNGSNIRIQLGWSPTAIQSGCYSSASFINTAYTGRSRFCIVRTASGATTFANGSAILPQSPLAVSKVSWNMAALGQTDSTGSGFANFMAPATIQACQIMFKPSEVDRVKLEALTDDFINRVLLL